MKRVLVLIVMVAVVGGGGYQLWLYIEKLRTRVVYRITEVCHPCVMGWAINNRGQVAGVLEIQTQRKGSEPLLHASFWEPGKGSADLGTLGGLSSRAQDINEDGLVVGIADLPPGRQAKYSKYQTSDGFIWRARLGMLSMTKLIPGRWVEGISPVGINNVGQVVGCATFHGYDGYHAFFWDPKDGMKDLGTLGGKYSCAVDVNDKGQVIGNSDLPGTQGQAPSHAFLWEPGRKMKDLGTLGGKNSYARAINNAGHIVGSSHTVEGALHAILWKPGQPVKDLGTLGGKTAAATGINEAGVVVGDSTLPEEAEQHAFIWQEGHEVRDLHDFLDPDDPLANQVFLRTPRGINDQGQILVEGEFFKKRQTYGVVLTPMTNR